ncbi:histidine phosphatase family protein [Adhaeribacter aquaticus]|uniref:histidine phosphatase family protein n=1 Tax=Adhaeribacter aquaticus TaxID=299567 RepID=UPI0006877A0F|nr:histidine phosphatase family protein [Adhaeribacter aquaticus]
MGRFLLLFIFLVEAVIKLMGTNQANGNAISKNAETVIYLVRHAEKVTSNPNDENPGLTEAGMERAEDLKQYLRDVEVDAFFSTPYKRNQLTIKPTAAGKPIQFYEPHDYTGLRDRILKDFQGKTVLIVGHSNSLLPIVEAFGAKKPVALIGENDYDNIFKLEVSARGKVRVQPKKYGKLNV